MSYNKTISEGRMTRDPELGHTATKTPYCNYDIAMDDGFGKNKKTTYITVTSWGKQAEFVAKSFKKGDGILVEGRLSQDQWPDKVTGKTRYRHRITAEKVQFPVGSKKHDYSNEEETGQEEATPPSW